MKHPADIGSCTASHAFSVQRSLCASWQPSDPVADATQHRTAGSCLTCLSLSLPILPAA